jgi:hypothetical protein
LRGKKRVLGLISSARSGPSSGRADPGREARADVVFDGAIASAEQGREIPRLVPRPLPLP